MSMGFIFGPVPSRRLGLSLGINIIPFKTCSYNCIYCEVGKTTDLTIERKSFFDVDEIKREFVDTIEKSGKIDFVTFSGSGEPTLNSDLGALIKFVKSFVKYKTAVLTNGSLMYREDVREDLMDADLVIPSLDSVLEPSFKKINMPHSELQIKSIVDGLAEFSKAFKGEIWLEILFVKGVNDSQRDIEALCGAINYIKPTRVQIGTVDRPPAYTTAKKLNAQDMMDIYTYMSAQVGSVDIIGSFNKENDEFYNDIERSIVKMINIRPCSKEELKETFNVDSGRIDEILAKLLSESKAYIQEFEGKEFIVGNRSAANK
jgi:wyosine [tRNA(Phe)-imidazoG37] synthetase (radical SAM superfamily)